MDARVLERAVLSRDDWACPYCLGQTRLLVRRVYLQGPAVETNLETICDRCLEEIYPEAGHGDALFLAGRRTEIDPGELGGGGGVKATAIRGTAREHRHVERRQVILAAIDDSPAAVPVARWAGEAARAAGGQVVVFTAVPILPDIRGLAGLGWIDERGHAEEGAAATVGRVRPVLDCLGVPYEVEVRTCLARRRAAGRARQVANAALRPARDVGADLVVIGHRSDRKSLRSSVAARVVRWARPDVLVVPMESVPAPMAEAGPARTGEGRVS